MNKDQGSGVIERFIYGAVVFLVMRYGAKFGISGDAADWFAGGAVAAVGGAWAWWKNRPVSVLNRAGAAIPENTKLVIVPTAEATHVERREAVELANAASDKVVAQGQ